jgi:hypothetical protein
VGIAKILPYCQKEPSGPVGEVNQLTVCTSAFQQVSGIVKFHRERISVHCAYRQTTTIPLNVIFSIVSQYLFASKTSEKVRDVPKPTCTAKRLHKACRLHFAVPKSWSINKINDNRPQVEPITPALVNRVTAAHMVFTYQKIVQ